MEFFACQIGASQETTLLKTGFSTLFIPFVLDNHFVLLLISAALENVRESVDELAGLGARETDIAFLKELMDSNVITSLVAVCIIYTL